MLRFWLPMLSWTTSGVCLTLSLSLTLSTLKLIFIVTDRIGICIIKGWALGYAFQGGGVGPKSRIIFRYNSFRIEGASFGGEGGPGGGWGPGPGARGGRECVRGGVQEKGKKSGWDGSRGAGCLGRAGPLGEGLARGWGRVCGKRVGEGQGG